MKISTKLAALFSTIFILVGLLPYYFYYTVSIEQLEKSVAGQLKSIANDSMATVDQTLYEHYLDIRVLAADPVLTSGHSTVKQISERLMAYKNGHPAYVSLSFFDLKRIRMADTAGVDIGRAHSYSEFWPEISMGKDFVANLSYSESLKSTTLHFAAIVRDQSGKPLGVVVVRISPASFNDILEKHVKEYDVKSEVSLELVDEGGHILFANRNAVDALSNVSHEWVGVKKLIDSGVSAGSIRHSVDDEFLVFAREQAHPDFKWSNWTLLIEMPENVALTQVAELRDRLRLILFAMAAFIFPIILLFSRAITKPIRKLRNASTEIGMGNLNARVDIASNDEIGELATSFNRMANDLQEENAAREKADESRREQYELTSQIIEAIPMRVFWKDRALRYLGANTAFAKDAGEDEPAKLIGRDDYQMGWREQAECYRLYDKLVMDFDAPKLSYDQPQKTPNGDVMWLRTSKVPLHNEVGEVIGVLGTYEDITASKNVEIALQKSEERFRLIMESAPVGIAITDLAGRLVQVNIRFCDLLGIRNEELKKLTFGDVTYPDDLEISLLSRQRLLNGEVGVVKFEKRYLHKDGNCVWAEVNVALERDTFGEPLFFISMAEDISERKRSEDIIRHQASFDSLTDLPNRTLFIDRLSKELFNAKRKDKCVALIYLDLDGFKRVNDEYGHDAGDTVLKTVAKRWLARVRETDTIARLGGDEFAIILGELDTPGEAAAIARKLIETLVPEIPLPKGQKCKIGVSMGIGIYPDNAIEMDSLIAAADSAMYESKANGKNTYTFSSAIPAIPGSGEEWLVFNNSHLVGADIVDEQHRQMIRLVNQLNIALANKFDVADVKRQFEELIKLTVFHFETEHQLMVKYAYPGAALHDMEHERLLNELNRHLMNISSSVQGSELLALQITKDWLLGHILNVDKPLGDYLVSRGYPDFK